MTLSKRRFRLADLPFYGASEGMDLIVHQTILVQEFAKQISAYWPVPRLESRFMPECVDMPPRSKL